MPMPADLPDVVLNSNAEVVLKKRYLRKGLDGKPTETPREMFWRVAAYIASMEQNYPASTWKKEDLARVFYTMMTENDFLPNSPTLMNAGTDLGQLAACFVLPVGDSMDEIFDAVKNAALIHKSGGGTGFSFSRLRPKDSRVGSTGGVASGPISFLKIFNTATEQVKQGGTRRGANMGILRVDHPDILEFIRAKERDGDLNNFNLSVALTERFMQAVENDEEYDLVAPHTREVSQTLRAREVFDLLVRKAWESGDPGIIFLDRINRDNPTPDQGEIESTNPCGEQPLLPYEACNLGSINLARFVRIVDEKPEVDWERLRTIIHLSVRFLDNVIDASAYPLELITETVRQNRKIGLGVMGWADLLYQLGLPYDSRRAIQLAETMMDFVQKESKSASKALAAERGAFPAYATSLYKEQNLGPYRNATTSTIAPTGTLSIIAGCSSGIEPLFALCFVRQVMDGEKLPEANSYFVQALHDSGCYSEKIMDAVIEKGSVRGMDFIPETVRSVFATAMDIDAQW
ncbi:MAG: adenosylcobalamin-dependent ribonucleoside-diphosphate reductase, partial [Desulfovibrionales bacterium]|nr:adenosylcobalamin-dependent ribonucleoside-diphosphate reductase [Desulfovibrionales bacterium]